MDKQLKITLHVLAKLCKNICHYIVSWKKKGQSALMEKRQYLLYFWIHSMTRMRKNRTGFRISCTATSTSILRNPWCWIFKLWRIAQSFAKLMEQVLRKATNLIKILPWESQTITPILAFRELQFTANLFKSSSGENHLIPLGYGKWSPPWDKE